MTKRNTSHEYSDYISDFESETSSSCILGKKIKSSERDLLSFSDKELNDSLKPNSRLTNPFIYKTSRNIVSTFKQNAYERHKEWVNNYIKYYGGKRKDLSLDPKHYKTDMDVVRENYRFIYESDDEAESSWESRLAKRYWDRLFKEYAIVDLSFYKSAKFGMRWRSEKEVIRGKGQFICGSARCDSQEDLTSWEVDFSYIEKGIKRNALVKVRLCSECSKKLNYGKKHTQVTKEPKTKIHHPDSIISPFIKKENNSNSSNSPINNVVNDNVWDMGGAGPSSKSEAEQNRESIDSYFEDMFL